MATRDADYYRELGRRSAQKRIAEHGTAHLKAIAPLGGQALRESPLRRNGGRAGGPALLAQRGVEHFRRAKLAAMANERPIPRLRELREQAGWAKKQLAASAGLSPATIRNAENGKAVRPFVAERLARALSTDVASLR